MKILFITLFIITLLRHLTIFGQEKAQNVRRQRIVEFRITLILAKCQEKCRRFG